MIPRTAKSDLWKIISLSVAVLPCVVGILISLAIFGASLLFSEWMASSNALPMLLVLLFVPWSFAAILGVGFLVSEKIAEPFRLIVLLFVFGLSAILTYNFFEYQALVDRMIRHLLS